MKIRHVLNDIGFDEVWMSFIDKSWYLTRIRFSIPMTRYLPWQSFAELSIFSLLHLSISENVLRGLQNACKFTSVSKLQCSSVIMHCTSQIWNYNRPCITARDLTLYVMEWFQVSLWHKNNTEVETDFDGVYVGRV
jgi:hypothetical protein